MKCLCLTLEAGEGRWGTDELAFNEVLAKRSYKQLRATFQAYQIVSDQAPRQGVTLKLSLALFLREATIWNMELGGGELFYNRGFSIRGHFAPGYLIMSGNIWGCYTVCY